MRPSCDEVVAPRMLPRLVARLGVALLLFALFTLALAQSVRVSPSDILATPDRYDGQYVTLSGTITNLRETVSRRGNPYYTFDLSDGKATVRVFSFGTPPCRAGGATVEGTYQWIKRQGRYTFHNEVTASRIMCH